MKRAAVVALTVTFACASDRQEDWLVRLPSGNEVKVVAAGPISFRADQPAFMLQYLTDIAFENRHALRAEVEEIWEYLRIEVEREGFNAVIIRANEAPKGFIVKRSRSQNFVIRKEPDGTWKFSYEGDQPTGGKGS